MVWKLFVKTRGVIIYGAQGLVVFRVAHPKYVSAPQIDIFW